MAVGGELLASIEGALREWLPRLFPGEADRADILVAIVTSQLFAFFVERLCRPGWSTEHVQARADAIAALVFPDADDAIPARTNAARTNTPR